jgi:IclR family transcriptional regulator, KDG regulon repressor
MTLIKSVEKAIDILSCFTTEAQYLTVIEITRRTGLNQSTVSRILTTLAHKNCVERLNSSGGYCLGSKFYQWEGLVKQGENLADVAKPAMTRLRDIYGEEVSLYVVNDCYRTCIAVVASTYGVARVTPIGMILPLHCGAAGKVLLAHLSDAKRRKIISEKNLEKFTSATMTDPAEIEEALLKIRTDGYAVSRGEREEGAFSLSAPVRNGKRQVIASLAFSGPTFRLSEEKYEKMLEDLLAAARGISLAIGSVEKKKERRI